MTGLSEAGPEAFQALLDELVLDETGEPETPTDRIMAAGRRSIHSSMLTEEAPEPPTWQGCLGLSAYDFEPEDLAP